MSESFVLFLCEPSFLSPVEWANNKTNTVWPKPQIYNRTARQWMFPYMNHDFLCVMKPFGCFALPIAGLCFVKFSHWHPHTHICIAAIKCANITYRKHTMDKVPPQQTIYDCCVSLSAQQFHSNNILSHSWLNSTWVIYGNAVYISICISMCAMFIVFCCKCLSYWYNHVSFMYCYISHNMNDLLGCSPTVCTSACCCSMMTDTDDVNRMYVCTMVWICGYLYICLAWAHHLLVRRNEDSSRNIHT